MQIVYRNTLTTESFRRLMRSFQKILTTTGSDKDSAHTNAWYLANDLYERLRSAKLDRHGIKLWDGVVFNAVRVFWATLICEQYPESPRRLKVSFDLVNKALSMLKNGSLTYENT